MENLNAPTLDKPKTLEQVQQHIQTILNMARRASLNRMSVFSHELVGTVSMLESAYGDLNMLADQNGRTMDSVIDGYLVENCQRELLDNQWGLVRPFIVNYSMWFIYRSNQALYYVTQAGLVRCFISNLPWMCWRVREGLLPIPSKSDLRRTEQLEDELLWTIHQTQQSQP